MTITSIYYAKIERPFFLYQAWAVLVISTSIPLRDNNTCD